MTAIPEVPCVFVAEDFEALNIRSDRYSIRQEMADRANARLAEITKGWPVVWLDKEENGWHASEHTNMGKTHIARLAFITPLAKVACTTHVPGKIEGITNPTSVCVYCDKKLVSTWTVSDD